MIRTSLILTVWLTLVVEMPSITETLEITISQLSSFLEQLGKRPNASAINILSRVLSFVVILSNAVFRG